MRCSTARRFCRTERRSMRTTCGFQRQRHPHAGGGVPRPRRSQADFHFDKLPVGRQSGHAVSEDEPPAQPRLWPVEAAAEQILRRYTRYLDVVILRCPAIIDRGRRVCSRFCLNPFATQVLWVVATAAIAASSFTPKTWSRRAWRRCSPANRVSFTSGVRVMPLARALSGVIDVAAARRRSIAPVEARARRDAPRASAGCVASGPIPTA